MESSSKTRPLFMFIVFMFMILEVVGGAGNSSKPSVINIGALFTYNSVIGRSAHPAIVAAIDDVNSDQTVLPGTKLNLTLRDTNCSGFLGTVEGNPFPQIYRILIPQFQEPKSNQNCSFAPDRERRSRCHWTSVLRNLTHYLSRGQRTPHPTPVVWSDGSDTFLAAVPFLHSNDTERRFSNERSD